MMGVDFLSVVVSMEELTTGDAQETLATLRWLLSSPDQARKWQGRVDLAFAGFNDRAIELWEVPSVRSFVEQLDEVFPYWLFFLSTHHTGLRCILLCLLPPFLTPIGQAQLFPERIGQILMRRWFPAMNQVCEYAGFSDRENKALTDRVTAYILG